MVTNFGQFRFGRIDRNHTDFTRQKTVNLAAYEETNVTIVSAVIELVWK